MSDELKPTRTRAWNALAHHTKETLRGLQSESGDPEQQHAEADEAICGLLAALGFGDVVAEWEAVPKWYS